MLILVDIQLEVMSVAVSVAVSVETLDAESAEISMLVIVE